MFSLQEEEAREGGLLMAKKMNIPKEDLKQKCVYYNGRMKCAFFGQEKCVHDKGMVPFPYSCSVEGRAEDEAMREPD